jgi:CPA1 family monovalent cation:H+ antiporter
LQSWQPIAAAYIVVMAARAGVVFLVLAIFRRSSKRIPWRWGAVLTWGGLRGALSMVLALALADDFPERSRVVTVTFGVVILSILVNGLTVGPILRWLGLAKPLRQ